MKPPSSDSLSASNSEPSPEEVGQLFLAACQRCGTGPLPDLEVFLEPFAEPKRSLLRAKLEKIQHEYISPSTANPFTEAAGHDTQSSRTPETNNKSPVDQFESDSREARTIEQIKSPGGTLNQITNSCGVEDQILAPEDIVNEANSTVKYTDPLDSSAKTTHGLDDTRDFELQEAPSAKPKLPQSVAGYEIIGLLGRGAMGVVYKARQRGLKRLVALKMILSGKHASAEDLARFRAEANAVAQLQHPGIVQIYEVGEDDGRPFFSLEFVDGPSLHQKLQGMPMSPRDAAALLQKMAEAMAYAHHRGVIHRDLKPANVLLTSDGNPKIGDFGLAKVIEDESGLTWTGAVLGTPSYMSPEQAEGLTQEIGPLSDVYSLGAILYDMLTGRPPFRGTSVMDTLQQLRTRDPVPPIQLQPSVPRDLETICLKCLEKDRNKRYANASALAEDLQRFLNREPIQARPISWAERSWRWCRRNPFQASTMAGAFLILIAWGVSVTVLALLWNAEKKEAIEAKGQAEINEAEAIRQKAIADEKTTEAIQQKGIAEQQKAIAKKEADEAIRQKGIAEKETERQRQTAQASINGVVDMVAKLHNTLQSKRLSIDASPEIRKLRAEVLADMRRSLTIVTQKIQAAASQTYADLYAAQMMGDMLMKFGQSQEPRQIFENALKTAKQRVEREPNNDRARGNLGVIEQRLGDVALDMDGDARTGLNHYRTAFNLHDEIRRLPRSGEFTQPEIKRSVAHDDVRIGRALVALGQAAEAKPFFLEARGYFEEWLAASPKEPKEKNAEPRSYVMQSEMWLGTASANLGDARGVEEHFGKALAIGYGLLKDFPGYLPFIIDQATAQGAYGDALIKLGKAAEAKKNYLESHDNLKTVILKQPDDTSNLPLLALTKERLGIVSTLLKEESEAKDYFKMAVELRKELYEVETSNLSRQIGYVLAMARTGERANSVRLANTIRTRMEKSPELMLNVARCFALFAADNTPDRKKHIEQALNGLGIATSDNFKDITVLQTDPELAALREEAGFKELIAKLKMR